jgi:hypothetical protein
MLFGGSGRANRSSLHDTQNFGIWDHGIVGTGDIEIALVKFAHAALGNCLYIDGQDIPLNEFIAVIKELAG